MDILHVITHHKRQTRLACRQIGPWYNVCILCKLYPFRKSSLRKQFVTHFSYAIRWSMMTAKLFSLFFQILKLRYNLKATMQYILIDSAIPTMSVQLRLVSWVITDLKTLRKILWWSENRKLSKSKNQNHETWKINQVSFSWQF